MSLLLTCPFCGFSKEIPKERVHPHVKWAVCPQCRKRFALQSLEPHKDAEVQKGTSIPPVSEGRTQEGKPLPHKATPWEKRRELGLWQGIYQTCKAVLFTPQGLFRKLPSGDGKREPFAFGLLIGSVGNMSALFWHFLVLSKGFLKMEGALSGHISLGALFLLLLAFVPMGITVGLLLYSVVLHILLLLVRGGENGFQATFRVVSYSMAAQVWSLIPFVGEWIGGVWQVIVQIIGLREVHHTSYLRVVSAFLIPLGVGVLLVLAVLIPFLYRLLNGFSG